MHSILSYLFNSNLTYLSENVDKYTYQGNRQSGVKDKDLTLAGNAVAYFIFVLHNGTIGNNGLYMYYPETSIMYELVKANNVTWSCNGYIIKLSCSNGTPYISYMIVA